MKTMISIYDDTTGMTLVMCHFPKFDGSIEQYTPFIIKEEMENGNKILHIDYRAYLKERHRRMWKHIAENSRIEFIDFSK